MDLLISNKNVIELVSKKFTLHLFINETSETTLKVDF
jgi:hypothetical protein